jgi:hypothetical protein
MLCVSLKHDTFAEIQTGPLLNQQTTSSFAKPNKWWETQKKAEFESPIR